MNDKKTFSVEKWKLIISAFASVFIPLVIFAVGVMIDNTIKQQELSVKYVELAVNILSEPPMPETQNLREWAIKNIEKYSEVPLDDKVQKELKTESFPTQIHDSLTKARNFTVPSEPRKVEYIVITDTETPTLKSVKNFISKPGASASYHYLIGVDGRIEKIVEEENIAWFAGHSEWEDKKNLNSISIGIGLVHLATQDGKNWLNLPKEHPAIGPDYTAEQLDALVNLLADITARYNLISPKIITKQDIAPDRRRTDLFGPGIKMIRDRVTQLRAGN